MRLGKDFYALRAPDMAPRLLGKLLCVRRGEAIQKYTITETECYYGCEDTACHAHVGMTARNRVMFEAGGRAYVYLCYGMHHMLNIVSGEADFPEAVLIRGVRGYNGPGKLTRALSIDRGLNGEDLLTSDRLWLEEGEPPAHIQRAPRVGIAYADKADRDRLWRFIAVEDA